jgi:hypothetical protein
MADGRKPFGLRFERAVPAAEVAHEDIVVLDGHVIEVAPDPEDADKVRLVLVPALGPPSQGSPDPREIVILCPRDMVFGVARPWNIEMASRQDRP